MIARNQARPRSDTPRSWPDGTPTARTTMPPRSARRGAGPLIAVVLALAVLGGSLFAGFHLGVFGGDREDKEALPTAAPPAAARPPEPAPATLPTAAPATRAAEPVAVDPPPPADPEPAAPAPAAEPPAADPVVEAKPAAEPPARARSKKKTKRSSPGRVSPPRPATAADADDDNTIDPFR